MKKQILFLAMFTLAIIFAGTNSVFGQLLPGVTDPARVAPLVVQPIDPLSCIATSEALHPFPGVAYTYSLTNGAGEVSANWTWWATKETSFITGEKALDMTDMLTVAPGELIATSAAPIYGTDNIGTTDGAGSVSITWSPEILAGTDYQGDPGPGTPTFVVGYSEGVNCADNIQVYEINPMPNFTIDIAAIDTTTGNTLAWDQNDLEVCVDEVQSATYNTTSNELEVDYGWNVLYFEVAAANFVTDWTPEFFISSGLVNTQTAFISMHTTLADARANTNDLWTSAELDVTDLSTTITTGTQLTAATPADAATGVSVYVRVVIYNNNEESVDILGNPFALAVDAIDNGAAGIWDMEDDDCTTLADAADQVDEATITVTPRPTLDHNTTDGGAPNPTNRVPKTGMDATDYPRF